MDVTDTGTRSEEEYAAEAAWFGRLRDHEPGEDPRTNALWHNDLVATAAPGPVAVEHDGVALGGEKERIKTARFFDEGGILTHDVIDYLPDGPYDQRTPIGTPEGLKPALGETW